jgi:type IV secretion system protein VirB5
MIRKLVVSLTAAFAVSLANAQGVPVYDNVSNLNMIQQLLSAANQLEQLKSQLSQLQNTYNALNGLRNVSSLLSNPLLSQMLPPDIAQTMSALSTGNVTGALAGVSGSLTQIQQQNAYISCEQQYGTGSAASQCNQRWQRASFGSYVGQQGYDQSAQNIQNMQQFLSTIQSSPDPKSLQDLQARIQLESVKQQNEQIKLQGIQMLNDAQEKMDKQNAVQATGQVLTTTTGIRF